MGEIHFHKYQGTGNDFIMIDDRLNQFDLNHLSLIDRLCDRRFGIGADGVILIRNHQDYDFEMIYFNPDGSQSLCGNGSRCAIRFAHRLHIIDTTSYFLAIDGPHKGLIKNDLIHIKMPDISSIENLEGAYFVNTGSPHHIKVVPQVDQVNVFDEGRAIRNGAPYGTQGTNVNFVEVLGDRLKVRTYERGVENETLSCGTGVTAVALALAGRGLESPITLETGGGQLKVAFEYSRDEGFTEVYLIGPAEEVFQGTFQC